MTMTLSEWRARDARETAERATAEWETAHESAISDAENLLDYVQRLNQPRFYAFDETLNDARGYLVALGHSLDALEKLANG